MDTSETSLGSILQDKQSNDAAVKDLQGRLFRTSISKASPSHSSAQVHQRCSKQVTALELTRLPRKEGEGHEWSSKGAMGLDQHMMAAQGAYYTLQSRSGLHKTQSSCSGNHHHQHQTEHPVQALSSPLLQ